MSAPPAAAAVDAAAAAPLCTSTTATSSSSSSTLPSPGQVVHRDFRRHDAAPSSSSTPDQQQQPLRIVTFNIERGYQLPKVIEQLAALQADVIALQEVDWGCERSGGVDTGAAIAAALGMGLLFASEFDELHSPLRSPQTQGGGVHGNALLSRLDFVRWGVVEYSHHPVDWELPPEQQAHPLAAKEPRRGRRLTLWADVAVPAAAADGQQQQQQQQQVRHVLRAYCCHLEVFCGLLSRVWQFSDVLLHVKQCLQQQEQQQEQQQQAAADPGVRPSHFAILGDLNTMGHSVARLSPNYCCDAMRWRSLGSSEAVWWQRHVLSVTDPPATTNARLLALGLPAQVAAAAVNPGFMDPWDAATDVTLDNPRYRLGPWLSLMAGKLDWVLLRGMRVVRKQMGNDDYAASDHKWLLVDAVLL